MTWKSLRLFVSILTRDDKYSLLSRDNLMEPIQMHLSQKRFSDFFLHFLNLHQILNILKKHNTYSLCISEVTDSKISG